MGKIVYSYYTDADAEAVAALFTRNQFYMGKYEPEMTGARFTENQQKKGMIFGIVGKDGDKVANYLACYTVGGQRVCAPGELLVGIILVDKKYRAAVFSIAEMFNLLLEKAVELPRPADGDRQNQFGVLAAQPQDRRAAAGCGAYHPRRAGAV